MTYDLISRGSLKDALHNEIGDHALSIAIERIIDNAQTVNPCENCDLYFKATGKGGYKGC